MNLPAIKRYPRYARSVVEHGTPTKIGNVLLVEWEMSTGKTKLSGYPYKIIIDTCNYCNLSCQLCPNGMKTLKRPQGKMAFDVYKIILDKIKKYALEISLHNWGEPFLNPDIFKIIEYTSHNNIGTNLSSNLHRLSDHSIYQIITSGLEYLVVSLDGITQEVYGYYRTAGNLPTVMDNLRKLISRKKELNSSTPYIEWQFLVMRHNEHQISEAKTLARDIGVDLIRFAPAGVPIENFSDKQLAEKWMPTRCDYWHLNPLKLAEQDFITDKKCFYLYRSMTINPEGSVSPCCVLYDNKYDCGNILEDDLDEIWNNTYYQSARALFSGRNKPVHSWTICNECKLFRKGKYITQNVGK